jgi:hydroxymethylbilane synthase
VISSRVKTLTIGSRGSHLALWQARYVAGQLSRLGVDTRIEIIRTTGDHLQTASLVQAGGKGLFTKEIEEALLEGAIDLAVHSLKDLPTEDPSGLVIAAIPEREDPRDAIAGCSFEELPEEARVGTSSGRRAAQLLALRPDLSVEPIRGNVDTRLRKRKEGQYHAILLAAAGLRRLGLESEIAGIFSPEQICPAPGQGALAIQTRVDDAARSICFELNHQETSDCVLCERTALATLGGGCQLPIGVFARHTGNEIHGLGVVASLDGRRVMREQVTGSSPESVGKAVAEALLFRGAGSVLNTAAD